MIQNLFIPGGLGFIGSHTVIEIFLHTRAKMLIFDDFSNCYPDVLDRLYQILQAHKPLEEIKSRITFREGNIMKVSDLEKVFEEEISKGTPIDGVMHFAAKKAIGESMQNPILYFENNVGGTLNILKMMEKYKCKNFIFSSTAGVYGDKDNCSETDELHPLSPYGQSKMAVEMLLKSLGQCHPDWRIISLRYFNPCGGHESALLGDEPISYPNNLFPFIQEVLTGKREKLVVFGSDYPTPDGTCIRDYIHVYDLALAHVKAMQKLSSQTVAYDVYNLGSGTGHSVLQILKGYEKVLGKKINYEMGERRKGDVSKLMANTQKANDELGWKVSKSLEEMCRDSVRFVEKRSGGEFKK